MSQAASQHPLTMQALDSATSPQRVPSLLNKVFHTHADFRVDSVEDVTPGVERAAADAQLQASPVEKESDGAGKKRAALMRMWWDEAMARHMVLSEGYSHVAVLIIRWADYLDDLRTKNEAHELEQVFKHRFRYETETVELNVTRKPQLQLNTCVSAFAEKHNGPNNLLIIYYTGHGVWREDEAYLQLTAAVTPIQGRGFQKDAHANWNRAEAILKADEIDADVLTILDTCYSSNMARSARASVRKFELLSACPHNETTSSPGDRSFTRVLIDKLTHLADEYNDKPFSTFHLNSLICMDPRRHDTPSQLWFRLPNEQNILLSPLQPLQTKRYLPSSSPKSRVQLEPRGYLTLRLAIKAESLTRPQIEYLAEKLSKAFGNKQLIGLRKIDWLEMRRESISPFERVALAAWYFTLWKKAVVRGRGVRGGGGGGGSGSSSDGDAAVQDSHNHDETDMSVSPRHALKRTHSSISIDINLPTKRRATDASASASTPPPTPLHCA